MKEKAELEGKIPKVNHPSKLLPSKSPGLFPKGSFFSFDTPVSKYSQFIKTSKHFCKLRRRSTNYFFYHCKRHFLIPVSSRRVKLILTHGIQVQMFGTMLNDYI